MSNRELFHYAETETRVPQRPLGEFSNYVVETLPTQAAEIRVYLAKQAPESDQIDTDNYSQLLESVPQHLKNTLGEELEGRFSSVTDEQINAALQDPATTDLALFDLMMADTVAAHYDIAIPPGLDNTLVLLAHTAGRPPYITYEDVVFTNPLDTDPRSFAPGEIGQSERDFYKAHEIIEGRMIPATTGLKEAALLLDAKGTSGIEYASQSLGAFSESVAFGQKYLGKLANDMPSEYFNIFRAPYFFAHPVRNPKDYAINPYNRSGVGPSGRFTGTFPLADMYKGQGITDYKMNDFRRIHAEGYYPRFQASQIAQAIQMYEQGLSIAALNERLGRPAALSSALNRATKKVDDFRRQHIRTVVRHIPQVAKGDQDGSGTADGESTMGYLEKHRILPNS